MSFLTLAPWVPKVIAQLEQVSRTKCLSSSESRGRYLLNVVLIRPYEHFTCQKARFLNFGVLSLFNIDLGCAVTFGTNSACISLGMLAQEALD